MRIAICEDTQPDAERLSETLSRYLDANSLDADVDFFTSGEDFISAFEPGSYQIIFMDIYMTKGGMTGMDAAEKVNALDKDAAIIFTTTSEEYLLAGYGVAVFYIVKPVEQGDLNKAMEKCRTQIDRFAKTVEIVVDRLPVQVRLRDIYCAETMNRNSVFTFAAGKTTVAGMNMADLADRLDSSSFIQCHKSYIVNLLHAKRMTKTEFILTNGDRVPIGRMYQAGAQRAYRENFARLVMGDSV
jgi:DNA-binding LytR/AlgR family response regulator